MKPRHGVLGNGECMIGAVAVYLKVGLWYDDRKKNL